MSFVAAAIIGGAGITAGASLIGDAMNGGQSNIQDVYTPGPGSSTSTGVENTWANFLNGANAGNNYNAISPDWSDIWNQTQQQVQNYFSGTATSPGVNDQINASFAQRGMSGDPAASYLEAASGANEAQDLGNLSAQQNIAQQEFAQQGQSNWLNSLNEFQNASGNTQAEGNWSGAVVSPTEGQQIAGTIGTLGSSAATYGLQQNSANNQMAYLNSILNPTTTSGYAPSVSSPLSVGGGQYGTV